MFHTDDPKKKRKITKLCAAVQNIVSPSFLDLKFGASLIMKRVWEFWGSVIRKDLMIVWKCLQNTMNESANKTGNVRVT